MKLNNEKMTAYVLGELSDIERQAVEEYLRGNEAAREAVAELQATADLARTALHAEEPVALEPTQRAAIETTAGHSARRRKRLSARWLERVAAAAIVLVLIGVTAGVLPGVLERSRLAERMTKADEAEYMHIGTVRIETSDASKSVSSGAEVAASNEPAIAAGPRRDDGQRRILASSRIVSEDSLTESSSSLLPMKKEMEQPAPPAGSPASGVNLAKERAKIRPRVEQLKRLPGGNKASAIKPYQYRTDTADYDIDINGDGVPQDIPLYSSSGAVGGYGGDMGGLVEGRTRLNEEFRGIPPGTHPPEFQDPNLVYWPDHNTEAYAAIVENPFQEVAQEPLSTFSIDVDTASYANTRRFLTQGTLPPPDSVRIEELVNYFDYAYEPPADKSAPFASHVEVAQCPWAPEHRLARIGLKGWEMAAGERPASNLVFLIDVSGSMQPENKLPLLKEALRMLVRQLDERDRIAMVVYAGSSGLVLPSTPGNELEIILGAIDGLESGGSTHGSAGIQLAYETAIQNYLPGGTNRVILCTDGDFNVGTTDEGQLTRLIEEKAKSKVFLTVLGFGMGNLKDSTLETLADKGNGNYGYIDTLNEARKVLVQGLNATLVTIAKDVKIQVEFNPAQVKAYRLIGYENRILAAQDFNDDTKDAGEIGAGHTVTALYELVPAGGQTPGAPRVDALKYQQPLQSTPEAQSGELLTLKLRYKQPEGDISQLLQFPVRDDGKAFGNASPDFRFASAVASFGMVLRGSQFKGNATYDTVLDNAQGGLGKDPYGYRSEFLQLVQKAKALGAPEPVTTMSTMANPE